MSVKKDTNPKCAMGIKKVGVHVVPMQVVGEVALAFNEGGRKYGSHNYREAGVRASTYLDAVWRHLFLQWWEGEDIDADSGLNHVTKAIASLFVLRDSMIKGNWVDDRPIKSAQMCGEFNKKVEDIIKKYPECAEPFTEMRRQFEEENKKMMCKECNMEMSEGKALMNQLSGIPDFVGDDYVCTLSPSGKADLVDCYKCPGCGYSVTKGKEV